MLSQQRTASKDHQAKDRQADENPEDIHKGTGEL